MRDFLTEEQSKCPFTGAGTPPKHGTGKGTTNRDWWPNQLKLNVLRQHAPGANPMGAEFDYAEAFNSLGLDAIKQGLVELMTQS